MNPVDRIALEICERQRDKARQELAEAKKDKEKWEAIARNIEDFREDFVRGEKAENENLRSKLTTAQAQAEKDKAAIERLTKERENNKLRLAIANLLNAKGRHNSGIAYERLMKVFNREED